MITEHYDAIKARLEAAPGLAGKVWDTVRMDSAGGLVADNYVVLFSPTPQEIVAERLTLTPDWSGPVPFDADVRAVGTSAGNVRAFLDRILGQLTGHRLAVSGRQPAPLRVVDTTRVIPDTTVKPFLYFADVSLEWTSRPA